MNKNNPFGKFNTQITTAIAAVIGAILLVLLIVAGGGLLVSLFTIFILAIAIYFGALRELAGSIVVGFVLKQFLNDIHIFTGIWWTGITADDFFRKVESTGQIRLILVIFFFTYTVSFLTGRIKLFQVHAKTTIEPKSD